jgi:hypothetical protein
VTGPTGPPSAVTGPTGVRGATLLAGNGLPLTAFGENGDWYIDLNASDFYGPKSGGVWGPPSIDLLAITGPTGVVAFSVTASAPTGVANGSLWQDDDNGKLFIRHNGVWVQIAH